MFSNKTKALKFIYKTKLICLNRFIKAAEIGKYLKVIENKLNKEGILLIGFYYCHRS